MNSLLGTNINDVKMLNSSLRVANDEIKSKDRVIMDLKEIICNF